MGTSDAIKNSISNLDNELKKQVSIQNDYANRGSAKIQKTYTDLVRGLVTSANDQRAEGDRGYAQIDQQYGRSQNDITGLENDLIGQIGIDDMGDSTMAELKRIAAENKLSESDSLSSMKLLTSGYNAAARGAVTDARFQNRQAKTDLRSQVGAEIGELQRTYNRDRSDMEVQLQTVLADERYKQQQLALERQRLAAENSARSSAQAAANQRFKGREGLMAWAAQNKISKEELNTILSGINRAGVAGDPAAAYGFINQQAKVRNDASLYNMDSKNGVLSRYAAKKPKSINLDALNTGLDIYFGNYASYE